MGALGNPGLGFREAIGVGEGDQGDLTSVETPAAPAGVVLCLLYLCLHRTEAGWGLLPHSGQARGWTGRRPP